MTFGRRTAWIGSALFTGCITEPTLPGAWRTGAQVEGTPATVRIEVAGDTRGDAATGYFHRDDLWARYDVAYEVEDRYSGEGYAAICRSGSDPCRWDPYGQLHALPDLDAALELAPGHVVVLGLMTEGCEDPYGIGVSGNYSAVPIRFEGGMDVTGDALAGDLLLGTSGCFEGDQPQAVHFTRE